MWVVVVATRQMAPLSNLAIGNVLILMVMQMVVDIDGDGSFLMNCQELATAFIEKLDVKMFILNNQHLGMVVQWEDRFYKNNRAHTYLGHRVNTLHTLSYDQQHLAVTCCGPCSAPSITFGVCQQGLHCFSTLVKQNVGLIPHACCSQMLHTCQVRWGMKYSWHCVQTCLHTA